jgi:protein involved in polysaccharide export with SLBB domain
MAAACATPRRIADRVATVDGENSDVAALNRDIALAAGQRSGGSADYRIGADDLLEVTLFDVESRNGEPRQIVTRVSQSGLITLPLVGGVAVGSRTPVEAEGLLRERYRKFIHDPQLAVFVKEYRSYRVSVVGYVGKPGVYEVSGERTLLEVLAMARGLNEKAGKTVQISRPSADRRRRWCRPGSPLPGRRHALQPDHDAGRRRERPEGRGDLCGGQREEARRISAAVGDDGHPGDRSGRRARRQACRQGGNPALPA